MSEGIAPQLDYQKIPYNHPSYRMLNVLPLSGQQTVTVTTSGGQESIFEIPVEAFNLPRSYLYFTMTPAATAARCNYLFQDCVSTFQQVQYLCDLNNANNYTKIVMKPETKLEDFLDYDVFGHATIYPYAIGRFLCRNNALNGTQSVPTASTPGGQNYPFPLRHDNTSPYLNFTEPKYLEPGQALNSASPVFNIGLPLAAFKNTILNLDKDIYAGEILILRIVWASSNKIAYLSTTGAAPLDPTAGAAAYAANMAISNLALFLAVEKNQDIKNQLIAKSMQPGGLQILIPYVYSYKIGLGGTSQTVSLRFNRGNGMRLKKIYHSIFNSTESTNVAYDHDERNNAKVQVFYTMLDNNRLQDYNVTTANLDDWLLLHPKLKGSVIQNADMFYYNWVWIEDFTEIDNKHDPLANNKDAGLDLSVERKWDFYGMTMTNANYQHYTYAVCEKMLSIQPGSNGITVL